MIRIFLERPCTSTTTSHSSFRDGYPHKPDTAHKTCRSWAYDAITYQAQDLICSGRLDPTLVRAVAGDGMARKIADVAGSISSTLLAKLHKKMNIHETQTIVPVIRAILFSRPMTHSGRIRSAVTGCEETCNKFMLLQQSPLTLSFCYTTFFISSASHMMADVEGALSLAARQELRTSLLHDLDPFISSIPKIELHIHIEGIITPEMKWTFANRNGITLTNPRTGTVFSTLDEYRDSHDPMKPHNGERMNNSQETLSFFEAYYSGFEVLKTRQDYYDLAMTYYERAAAMNVRYCEIFFDPQGHTRTGTAWDTMMLGFREAQVRAETNLKVGIIRQIMCTIAHSL